MIRSGDMRPRTTVAPPPAAQQRGKAPAQPYGEAPAQPHADAPVQPQGNAAVATPPTPPTGSDGTAASGGDGGDGGGRSLAGQLSDLARSLHAAADQQQLLDHIVRAAVREIPGADDAGIVLMEHGRLSTAAATARVVAVVHRAQYDAGRGPALLAARHLGIIRVDEFTGGTDWPAFDAAARAAGIASSLSIHLFVHDGGLGALTLYSRRPRAFDREAEGVGMLFASHAAIALSTARLTAHLQTGLAGREVIGQAQGILMERLKVTAAQAFDLLITASQHHNIKLRDIAAYLVETGELPQRPPIGGQRRG